MNYYWNSVGHQIVCVIWMLWIPLAIAYVMYHLLLLPVQPTDAFCTCTIYNNVIAILPIIIILFSGRQIGPACRAFSDVCFKLCGPDVGDNLVLLSDHLLHLLGPRAHRFIWNRNGKRHLRLSASALVFDNGTRMDGARSHNNERNIL